MARTVAVVTPKAQAALDVVAAARQAYLEAETAYCAACVSAHAAGANFNAIGALLGLLRKLPERLFAEQLSDTSRRSGY